MSYCKSKGLNASLRTDGDAQPKGNNVQRGLNVHKDSADVRKERAGVKAEREEEHNAKYLYKRKDVR